MNRDDVLRLLAEHRKEIDAFRVRKLLLFGSVARGEAGAGSDVDMLVEFDAPATFDRYIGLRLFLEDLLGCRVDLVTERGIKPRARPYVERDAIRVA